MLSTNSKDFKENKKSEEKTTQTRRGYPEKQKKNGTKEYSMRQAKAPAAYDTLKISRIKKTEPAKQAA